MIGIQPREGNRSRCFDGAAPRLTSADCRRIFPMSPMSRFTSIPERALELAMQAVPEGADKWLKTGVALGTLKTGSRVAGSVIRRHPAMTVAAAAAAGLLWYLARRQAHRANHGPIDGGATRVEARRAGAKSTNGGGQARSANRKSTAGKTGTRSRARKTTSTH